MLPQRYVCAAESALHNPRKTEQNAQPRAAEGLNDRESSYCLRCSGGLRIMLFALLTCFRICVHYTL